MSDVKHPTHTQTIPFDTTLMDESVALFMRVFSQAPWHDVFESKEEVAAFFRAFIELPTFKGYQLLSENGDVIGLSIGFIKPWMKDGKLRYEYFLDQFCIDHRLQGQGLGKAFLREIEADLRENNIQDIILNTELSSPAFHFYRRTGFYNMEGYGFLAKEI